MEIHNPAEEQDALCVTVSSAKSSRLALYSAFGFKSTNAAALLCAPTVCLLLCENRRIFNMTMLMPPIAFAMLR